jgi:hypothetical protein
LAIQFKSTSLFPLKQKNSKKPQNLNFFLESTRDKRRLEKEKEDKEGGGKVGWEKWSGNGEMLTAVSLNMGMSWFCIWEKKL